MIANGTDNIFLFSGARRFGAWGMSLLFPAAAGFKQTDPRIGDKQIRGPLRFAGLVANLVSIHPIVLPVKAAYNLIVSGIVEACDPNHKYPTYISSRRKMI